MVKFTARAIGGLPTHAFLQSTWQESSLHVMGATIIMRGGSPSLTILADGPDAAIFEAAMQRALELVNADGGSIITYDDIRQAMVLRVRQVHPRLQTAPRPVANANNPNGIEEITTTVLSAANLWRVYRPGERLVGYIEQYRKPVIMRGDDVRGLPGISSPEDPNAAWHMAVPIYAVLPASGITATGTLPLPKEPRLVGAITVHVNDPQWRFTQNHILLLQTHAQNLAQSLRLAAIERQEKSHRRLLSLLREMSSEMPIQIDAPDFYDQFCERVRIALSGAVNIEAFAVAIAPPRSVTASRPVESTLALYAVTEQNKHYPSERIREDRVPWWSFVRIGKVVSWITDDERRMSPQYRLRTWGSQRYMDSQLFIPMRSTSGVIGALLVASSRTQAYSSEDVGLLEMAGRYIALALENAHMRRLQRDTPGAEADRTLSLLNNSLLGLNATLDVGSIVCDLVEQASELARGQICCYLEYDQYANELIIRDIAQNKEHPFQEVIDQHLPVGEGRRRRALDGEVFAIEDVSDEYERGDIIGTLLQRYHIRALLLAPVIYSETITRHNRVLGMLVIYSPDQHAMFSPAEEMNLMALGRVAASAIHNARTYAQLRELDRLKDEFILTASHEFRTPMSAIQGFSWLIQRRVETMTPEQGKHWAGEIIRATEQLKDMMDTITEAWRTKSVLMPPIQPVNLHAVVQFAMEISSPLLTQHQHPVIINVPEEIWVRGDQDRLRHVFSNLLTNAAKYSPDKTQVTISVAKRTGSELQAMNRERGTRNDDDEPPINNVTSNSGPWIVVSVRDEGAGISLQNQKRLFAKFVRLELTTSVRGTGLGLYICRRYIEAMGGEIWVESMPGQGSTFSFCLLRSEQPEK
jgi:signal transduction histidine kinase